MDDIQSINVCSQEVLEGPLSKKIKIEKDMNDISSEVNISNEILGTNDITILTENTEKLSKKQLKRLDKKKKWLISKGIKRAKEKEKLKQKKLDARLNNIKLGPSRKELKDSTMSNSRCKIRIAIDLSFDDLMNDKEIGKCIKQLLRCYSLNRRANDPVQFYITSFDGKSKREMQKHSGYTNWDVNFRSESFIDIFDSKDLIYLTSESDNVISSIEEDKVYIIGGLVDHNSQKGLCHQIAKERGINHGQLPIGEFLDMKSRKVLTIDHVFQILLEVSGGKSWKDAFLQVLPSRKGATEKIDAGSSNNSSSSSSSSNNNNNNNNNSSNSSSRVSSPKSDSH